MIWSRPLLRHVYCPQDLKARRHHHSQESESIPHCQLFKVYSQLVALRQQPLKKKSFRSKIVKIASSLPHVSNIPLHSLSSTNSGRNIWYQEPEQHEQVVSLLSGDRPGEFDDGQYRHSSELDSPNESDASSSQNISGGAAVWTATESHRVGKAHNQLKRHSKIRKTSKSVRIDIPNNDPNSPRERKHRVQREDIIIPDLGPRNTNLGERVVAYLVIGGRNPDKMYGLTGKPLL